MSTPPPPTDILQCDRFIIDQLITSNSSGAYRRIVSALLVPEEFNFCGLSTTTIEYSCLCICVFVCVCACVRVSVCVCVSLHEKSLYVFLKVHISVSLLPKTEVYTDSVNVTKGYI